MIYMRIGIDGRKIPGSAKRGPLGILDDALSLNMDGVFYRTVLDVSPDLDASLLRDVRQKADDLDLYMEAGLGKVNPYATPDSPELRAAGDGDIVLGFRRMMKACADIDVRELWISTAGAKPFKGRFGTDRFRTDVTWQEQLEATARFLMTLAPVARELGIHLNLETHEEITTFEIVRLIEKVGGDVIGIVFDTSNVLIRGEHPVLAAKRVAPYVRQTHFKDAYVELVQGGAFYEAVACGMGVIDYQAVLSELKGYAGDLNITLECEQPRSEAGHPTTEPLLIELFEPAWLDGHPDLSRDEFAAYIELVRAFSERVRSGEVQSWQERRGQEFEYAEAVQWISNSETHLVEIFKRLEITRSVAAPA